MEVIKKVINLDDFKSHINGNLPFIPSEEPSLDETNFGSFIYDSEKGRTCSLMRKYNIVLEIFRNSIHLKRQSNYACQTSGKSNVFFSNFEYEGTTNDFFNEESLGIYEETEFKYVDENVYNSKSDITEDYIILLSKEDYITYMLLKDDYVYMKDNIYTNNTDFNIVPYIPINVVLENKYSDVGLMTTYYDWFDGEDTFKEGNTIDWFEGVESSGLCLEATNVGNENITLETRLSTLRLNKYFSDDSGAVLPGIFENFENEEGKFYKYTKSGGLEPMVNGDGLVCGDDEAINGTELKYRTFTILETLNRFIEEGTFSDTGTYYFLVKYDNSQSVPMKIPYVTYEVYNKDFDYITSAYTGDYIRTINKVENRIYFTYILGAIFPDETYSWNTATGGVVYNETYYFESSFKGTANIDGYSNVEYWYENIDFDGAKQEIVNKDFNLSRTGNVSNVLQMSLGDVWKMDGSVLNTKVFKEDYLMGVSFDSKVNLDVEINRGNAAAFERHLRLSEANTLQDLEEIGNGMYL